MKQSLAIAYAMKRKARKMADGGNVETLGTAIGYPGSPSPKPKKMSDGGEVEDEMDGDLVDRIMARRGNKTNLLSEGGQVANGSMTEGLAGELPNEFDDLVLRDELEQSYTGANSGDEIGNAQEDSDREDMVSKIMRSRAKKDRLPRPA